MSGLASGRTGRRKATDEQTDAVVGGFAGRQTDGREDWWAGRLTGGRRAGELAGVRTGRRTGGKEGRSVGDNKASVELCPGDYDLA